MIEVEEGLRREFEWFGRVISRFGWFHALPASEITQPILVGLAFAVPVVGLIAMMFNW